MVIQLDRARLFPNDISKRGELTRFHLSGIYVGPCNVSSVSGHVTHSFGSGLDIDTCCIVLLLYIAIIIAMVVACATVRADVTLVVTLDVTERRVVHNNNASSSSAQIQKIR